MYIGISESYNLFLTDCLDSRLPGVAYTSMYTMVVLCKRQYELRLRVTNFQFTKLP